MARVSGGGQGNFGGESLASEESLALEGRGASSLYPTKEEAARGAALELELRLEEALEMAEDADMRRHYEFRMTDEGPALELEERSDSRLFDEGTATPTSTLRSFLRTVAATAKGTGNAFVVAGHMGAKPLVLEDNPTWRLSLERADKVRELLENSGLPRNRLKRVTGFGDQKLKYPETPMAIGNNRIEIIILRNPLPVPLVRH